MAISAVADKIYAAPEFPKWDPDSAESENEAPHAQIGPRRVLVVDDQKLIADSLAEILRNQGFGAQAAYDGLDALDAASKFNPDCLLSDVLMPGMNGVELAIAMRMKNPKLTIFLISGQAGISDILEEGLRRGYQFELIPKPVHPLELVARLRAVNE
jgi:DNA-binding response OmpR family regulator